MVSIQLKAIFLGNTTLELYLLKLETFINNLLYL